MNGFQGLSLVHFIFLTVVMTLPSAGSSACVANYGETVACCDHTYVGVIPSALVCPFATPICRGYKPGTSNGTCIAAGQSFAEMGTTILNHRWKTVVLQRVYTDPVVVASVSYNEKTLAATYRIKDVTSTTFKVRMIEEQKADGFHADETLYYLVMEAGNHYMEDGTQIAAGKHHVTKLNLYRPIWRLPNHRIETSEQCKALGGGNSYNYCPETDMSYCCQSVCSGKARCPSNPNYYGCACDARASRFSRNFTGTPALLASIMTTRHEVWMYRRIGFVDGHGFNIAIQQEQLNNSGWMNAPETVGWVAVESKSRFSDNHGGSYGAHADTNRKKIPACPRLSTVTWGSGPFTNPIAVMSDMSVEGGDPCDLRQTAPTSTSVQICVEEEISKDNETAHAWERYAYMLREGPGLLYEGVPTIMTQTPTESPTITQHPTATPTSGAPSTLNPTSLTPTTASPSTGAPTTTSPTSQAPTTASPSSGAPTTVSPSTLTPTSSSPTTGAPTTVCPSSNAPTTCSPSSDAPTTEVPTSESPTTGAPTTSNPTTLTPTTGSPTTGAPTTGNPTTLSPTTGSPTTTSPATTEPTCSPTTESPTTASPTTDSPATDAPSAAPTTGAPTTGAPTTTSPTSSMPTTGAPTTGAPSSLSPTTGSPATSAPSASPSTAAPVTAVPTETTVSPATQAPVTQTPTTGVTPSPTRYSATCSPLAMVLVELKAVLPATNGTDGVCGQMNRGLTGLIDTARYAEALAAIDNATSRVDALKSAPESCSAFLDFGCNPIHNVATTVQLIDTYMMNAFYRVQRLVSAASGSGNRDGLTLVQTMTRIVRTASLTQAERDAFSETAGNLTVAANATDIAQTTYGQDIGDLLSALIEKDVETAEAETEPITSSACASTSVNFGRVQRLLHKSGTALLSGGSPRRIDTTSFESWASRIGAAAAGQLQPSGAVLQLPRFSYQSNGVVSAGDHVVVVALRWKSRADVCRRPRDLSLESDVHTVSVLGDASRMADDVYFAAGETIDMTFTARASSSRAAQRTTGCSGPKECRWWNTATQAWDPSGCTYSETTESCSCTHLTDFAVVAPVIACPEAGGASSSGASFAILAAAGAIVVGAAVAVYLYCRRKKRFGKVMRVTTARVVPRAPSEERLSKSEQGEAKIGWSEDSLAQADGPETPRRELGEEDAKVMSPDEENQEYMRRCKTKFMLLTREYDMEVAMEKYEAFLERPREEILADPAGNYAADSGPVQNADVHTQGGDVHVQGENDPTDGPTAVDPVQNSTAASPVSGLGSPDMFRAVSLPGFLASGDEVGDDAKGANLFSTGGDVAVQDAQDTSSSDSDDGMSEVGSTALRQEIEKIRGGEDSGLDI